MFGRIRCLLSGHHFASSEAITPVKLLEKLVTDEFVYDIAFDNALLDKIKELAGQYKAKYKNATLCHYICTRCGHKASSIDDVRDKMRDELSAFLFRPNKSTEDFMEEL